ncbi:MAG TPA: DUF4054 domain-containing protein [Candidatus Paceibacterota bacterium]|nr:DUF4054 domain-containing protein [Candidatus Paceibacterota bacterium]
MISLSDIQARFPGVFDSVSPTLGGLVIAEAAMSVHEAKWGVYYDLGMLYLAAHLLTTTSSASGGGSGGGGPISSKSVGDVSISYATGSYTSIEASFASSPYGLRYIELRARVQHGPSVPNASESF